VPVTKAATGTIDPVGRRVRAQQVPPSPAAAAQTALNKIDAAVQALTASIPNYADLVRQGTPDYAKLTLAAVDQGAPLPDALTLPPEKRAWIETVIPQVEATTGMKRPARLVFAYTDERNTTARLHGWTGLGQTTMAMEFARTELSFSFETIAHELAHGMFREALIKESPLVAKRLALAGTVSEELAAAYRVGALAIRPALVELENKAAAAGFPLSLLNDPKVLQAHDELFADLVSALTRNDPDAEAKLLRLGGHPAEAEYRTFAQPLELPPRERRSPHTFFAPLRKKLWDIHERSYAGRNPEFVQGLVRALARSCEYHTAAKTTWIDMFDQDPQSAIAVLDRAIEAELVAKA
jgi:hypothetical protein